MMKKFCSAFLFFFVLSFVGIQAQNVTATKVNTRDANPGKKYLRPSLTIIYAERSSDRSRRMMNIISKSPVPGKFNDHNVETKSIKVNGEYISPTLSNALNGEISRQIVAKWFNRNSKGEFSMDLIGDRGLYNATDADVMKAKASQRKMDLLKDAGENLLDRSYIVVYDVNSIYTPDESAARMGYTSDKEGYIATYNCYLFKLDWNDSIAAIFYNTLWNDASSSSAERVAQFNKFVFPVKYVTTVSTAFGTIESTQFKDHNRNIFGSYSDEELFASLWDKIQRETDVSLAKVNEDFKVKTPVYSTGPVAAKIGLKEGLSVDRRFFVYEFEQDANGNKIAKRKAVVRAGSHICDNRGYSRGQTDTSTFYQVAGRRIYEGMLLQENPDWGIGLTLGYGTQKNAIGQGLTLTAEMSIGLWAGKAGLGLPTGMKIYGSITLPTDSNLRFQNYTTGTIYEYSYFSYAAGLSKDLYFARSFVLVPFVGYGQEQYSNIDSNYEKDKYYSEFIQFGGRLGINLSYNLQLIGNVSYNSVIGTKMAKDNDDKDLVGSQIADLIKEGRKNVQYSAGLRILF